MRSLARRGVLVLAGVLVVSLAGTAAAQQSKSAATALELTRLLDAAQLDSVAAAHPAEPDRFVAALYMPGSQLLVVSAIYAAPELLAAKIAGGEYREVYIDLATASPLESRIFIMDLGANGLQPRAREGEPYDTYQHGAKSVAFTGNWRGQQMTQDEYTNAFARADEEYAQLLGLLAGELAKGS